MPLACGQHGFSLVELVIAIVVLSVGLVALLIPITNATRSAGDPLVTKQMVAIAEAMLEEIELQPFANPVPGGFTGASTQANRPQFDDIFDYNGFTTGTAGITDIDGNAVAGLAAYNIVLVTVANPAPAIGAVPSANSALISVTVSGPNGNNITVSSFRTNYY